MTSQDVGIKSRLDVRLAKAQKREIQQTIGEKLKRKGFSMAGKMRRRIMAAIPFGVGALGGYSASRRFFGSYQQTNPWAEAWTPFQAAFRSWLDKEIGFSALANRSAREDTKNALATIVGETGNTSMVKDFFRTAQVIRKQEEDGRVVLRQHPLFLGPGFPELFAQGIAGYLNLVKESALYIADKLVEFGAGMREDLLGK